MNQVSTKPTLDTNSPVEADASVQLGKQMLADALAPVSEDLDSLEAKLLTYIPTDTPSAQDILKLLFRSGGKRIRPALYFFCCRMLNYRGDHLFPIAAVCEYVHTASLLHDDVVDSSTLRRNKPTANSIWGDQSSVLVGDLIYSRASEMMAATGSLEVVSTFARAIRLMSEGELIQLEEIFSLDTPEERYFKILTYKTAALIGASCKAAGLLAQVPDKQVEALETFGSSIGIAFQLVDDALDYLGSRELFGKPTLSDLKDGKVTMPVILLRTLVSPVELRSLQKVLSSQVIDQDGAGVVAELVEQYRTANMTIERAAQYTDQALAALALFPECDMRHDLEKIAKRLVWRFN